MSHTVSFKTSFYESIFAFNMLWLRIMARKHGVLPLFTLYWHLGESKSVLPYQFWWRDSPRRSRFWQGWLPAAPPSPPPPPPRASSSCPLCSRARERRTCPCQEPVMGCLETWRDSSNFLLKRASLCYSARSNIVKSHCCQDFIEKMLYLLFRQNLFYFIPCGLGSHSLCRDSTLSPVPEDESRAES